MLSQRRRLPLELAAGYLVLVVGVSLAGWLLLGQLATPGQPPREALPRNPFTPPASVHQPGRPTPAVSPEPTPPFPAAGGEQPVEPQPSGRLTILLLGVDQRPDEAVPGGPPGRTDTMLLVAVDFDTSTAAMVSIPRDGYVVIPGHGRNRVNAAYTLGELERPGAGPALARETVAQLFRVPVDRYALVDVRSLERLIDGLGGVWIDNPRRLVDPAYPTEDYGVTRLDIPAGRQLMDGRLAVAYARTRHPDSDFGREARQQQLLLAIRERVVQLDVIPRLPALLPDLLSLVRTDLSPTEILQLAQFGRDFDPKRDLATIEPDPALTPPYVGPGGAAYVELTSAYRSQVRQMLVEPRLAVEQLRRGAPGVAAPAGADARPGQGPEGQRALP